MLIALPDGAFHVAGTPLLVVVDIDGTLVDGNTNIAVAKKFARGFSGLRLIGKLTGLAVKAGRGKDVVADFMSAGSSLFVGKREEDLERQMPELFEKQIRPKIFREMRDRINEHKKQGARVWLAGPIPQQLADRLATEVGAERAFGIEVEKDARGRLTDRPKEPVVYREGKKQAVLDAAREEGIKPSEIRFYTDSASDLPLLEAVGEPVATNPGKDLLEEAKKRGWPIERYTGTIG